MAATAFAFDKAQFIAPMLISIRFAGVLLLTPVLSGMQLPASARLLLVGSLSVAVAGAMPDWPVQMPANTYELFFAGAAELALGATMGLGILIAFGAFNIGARILDVQIGFGMAQVFDPHTRSQQPFLSAAWSQFVLLLFFVGNGHHTLLRGIAYSIERYPPGVSWYLQFDGAAIFRQVAGMFSLGFALVAPVILCIFMVEFALAVISRNLPQMQMFALGIPLKMLIGMAALSVWFLGAGDAMTRIYLSIFQGWEGAFR